MHNVKIPDSVVARIKGRRGRLEVFDEISRPAAVALVVIDMQEAYVAKGAPLEVPKARGIVDNINRLAVAVRASGGTVIWVKMTMAASGLNTFPLFYAHFVGSSFGRKHLEALTEGAELHEIYSGFSLLPADRIVLKNRFSPLIQGASELHDVCKSLAIDTLIIAGTTTNVCCESTARDAMMLGYRVFMPSDASAAHSDDEHLAALVNVALVFGDIRDTDQLLALLSNAKPSLGARPV